MNDFQVTKFYLFPNKIKFSGVFGLEIYLCLKNTDYL